MEENSIEPANPTGFELSADEVILPRSIKERYHVVDGKFYDKKTGNLIFEDTGTKMVLHSKLNQTDIPKDDDQGC